MAYTGRVLVYGGKGALGAKCVAHFKAASFWVGSIDLADNPEANTNILVPKDQPFIEQEASILNAVREALNGEKLDGIFCVAGGWAGGNASKDLAKNAELMWQQSVCSSLITASLAAKYLKDNGVVQLTGAKAALEGTPGMIGYGLAKSAVHHLTKSLAAMKCTRKSVLEAFYALINSTINKPQLTRPFLRVLLTTTWDSGSDASGHDIPVKDSTELVKLIVTRNSGLPPNSTVVAILPITLDTPMNRKWMPDADHGSWTPLEFVADLFVKWTNGQNKPKSGALLQLITKESKTDVVAA